jgi:hypothetical protein
MAVSFSIKDVPEELADALRERARLNHRSLQGEMLAMIEAHVGARPFRARALWSQVKKLEIPSNDESVRMVREDRDRR